MARELFDWCIERNIAPRVLVSERPQIYTAGKTKSKPNDLIAMAGVTGAFAGIAHSYACRGHVASFRRVTYLPAKWKGQITKENVLERVMLRLDDAEAALVPARSSDRGLDAAEAIGLGLKALGRFEPRRVFPGAT
jgi:hypothetical protein